MPHFMTTLTYSADAKAALVANPTDRPKAAAAAIEAVGGKMHAAYLTFGESDALVIYEVPNAVAAAALAATLGTSGAFTSVKTTALLTGEEAIKAFKLSGETKAAYKPPASRP
ncbi:MAG TPA: GYD domain-containing protein [Steroidobacteraceae bacterium]|nr:GYD domain-containing protein [Steroidobacteraceae bacterium]